MHFFSSSHHLVARVYESKAEFRSALQHEKEGYTIYKNQVCSPRPSWGPGDGMESDIFLKQTFFFSFFLFSDGRGTREDQGELRVPEVPHPAGRRPAEDHERDLQERLQRQHHAPQGERSSSRIGGSIGFSSPPFKPVMQYLFFFYSLLFSSSLLPAWPVCWNSSTSSTASSSSRSGTQLLLIVNILTH